jgi:hypothetical protein
LPNSAHTVLNPMAQAITGCWMARYRIFRSIPSETFKLPNTGQIQEIQGHRGGGSGPKGGDPEPKGVKSGSKGVDSGSKGVDSGSKGVDSGSEGVDSKVDSVAYNTKGL